MAKTIKQIADEIGIDKQKIYRWIKKNCINDVHQKNGVIYIDDAVEILLIKRFNQEVHQEVHQNRINDVANDELIFLLRQELDVKNQQIFNMQKLLDQEQKLRMLSEQKVLFLESENSKIKSEEIINQELNLKKRWWSFFKNS